MVTLSLRTFDLDTNCLPVKLEGFVLGDPTTIAMRVKLRIRAPGIDQVIDAGMMAPAGGGLGGAVTGGAPVGDGEYYFNLSAELAPIVSAVPAAQRRFWCVYAVVTKATGLEASPLVCKGCGGVGLDPELHTDVVTTPSPTPATVPNRCSCYCLVGWIAPTATPDIPDPGQPTYTGWFTQFEHTRGSVKYTANVNRKDYNCPMTSSILAPVPATALTAVLTHHRYWDRRWRRRVTVWVKWGPLPWMPMPWGTWTPWTAMPRVADPVLPDRDALASGAPPLLPWCPEVGVSCP